MRKTAGTAIVMIWLFLAAASEAQQLSAKWEELTASDFVSAIQMSRGTCALPFGILEKHGPAGALGTDLINVRFATLKAAKDEYTIVFPEYYVGQIFEARHQPGTIAYSSRLQLEMPEPLWRRFRSRHGGARRSDHRLDGRTDCECDPRDQAGRDGSETSAGILREGGEAETLAAMSHSPFDRSS